MPTLKLTVRQWQHIRKEMHNDYPKTVFMIKDKMKRVLGFTVREHSEWIDGEHRYTICLDFYSENKYTMFLLKYSEYI